VLNDDDNAKILEELGLTASQARVYFASVKFGKATAKDIWRESGVGRQEVYRILSELLEMGLIEKEIATPVEFSSLPLSWGVTILLNQKRNEICKLEGKAKALMGTNKEDSMLKPQDSEFIILPRKYLMEGRGANSYKNARDAVEIIGPMKRILGIFAYNLGIYSDIVQKGVQLKVITDKPDAYQYEQLIKETAALFPRQNFNLRSVTALPEIGLSIIDGKEIYFCLYPGKSLFEDILLWSNSPPLIVLAQKYFETVWNSGLNINGPALS
jgi:hypothetical protein